MALSFYSPLKPIDSPTPSGDREISRSLFQFFEEQGLDPFVVSRFVSRRRQGLSPWTFSALFDAARGLQMRRLRQSDLLFTYHNYHKAIDWIHPFLSWVTGCPYVIFEASLKPSLRKTQPLKYRYLEACFQKASLLFTDVKKDYEILKALFPEKTHHIRLGVSESIIQKKEKVGDLNSTPQLVSMAMLRPDRKFPSVHWLVETLSEMQKEGALFHYHHIGGGECFSDLKDLCKEKLDEGTYSLHGTLNRSEAIEQLRNCDVFVYPGIGESFGMSYLEAQAQGLPVVAFATGGIAEAVQQGVSGFLCEPMNRQEYKQKIRLLTESPEVYRGYSYGAWKYICHNHDQNKNYGEMLELIREKTGLSLSRGTAREQA